MRYCKITSKLLKSEWDINGCFKKRTITELMMLHQSLKNYINISYKLTIFIMVMREQISHIFLVFLVFLMLFNLEHVKYSEIVSKLFYKLNSKCKLE